MPVRKLQTYIKLNELWQKVDLLTLSNSSQNITIAVEGCAAWRSEVCYSEEMSAFRGGEWMNYSDNLRLFTEKMKQLNIKLVWFFNWQRSCFDKGWERKQNQKLEKTRSIFEEVGRSGKTDVHTAPRVLERDTSTLLIELGEEVIFTADTKADAAIAAYARKHKECVAIMSNDTDFLMFDCQTPLVMDPGTIDLKENTVIAWDQNKLCDHLSLSLQQLPALAAVAGNDVIPPTGNLQQALQSWLYARRDRSSHVIDTVAKEIRKTWKRDANLTIRNFLIPLASDLRKRLLRKRLSVSDSEWEEFVELVCKAAGEYTFDEGMEKVSGMQAFIGGEQWSPRYSSHVYDEAWQRVCSGKLKVQTLQIMLGADHAFMSSIHEDPALSPPVCLSITLPFIKRFNGFLQNIIPRPDMEAVEQTVHYAYSDARSDFVKTDSLKLTPWTGTPLPELWKEDCSQEAKIKALKQLLQVEFDDVDVLPACVRETFLALLFLRGGLEKHEEAAFVAQAICPDALSDANLPELTRRIIHITTLFGHAFTKVVDVVQACGNPWPTVMQWKFYEGVTFAKKLEARKMGDEFMGINSQNDRELLKKVLSMLE